MSLWNLVKSLPTSFRYLPKTLFVNPLNTKSGGAFDDFKARYVDIHEEAVNAIQAANLELSGTVAASDDVTLSENLVFTEAVTSPATSSSMTLVQKQLVHTVVGGGGTEEIPINVPDDSLLVSAEILVSTILAFTTGTAATATWTNSTQQIGGTDALAAKNSKVTAFYDANANSAIATGTPETITLTADAGTIDSGVVVVIVRYWTLSGITNVA